MLAYLSDFKPVPFTLNAEEHGAQGVALWGAKEHTTRRNDCDDFHNEVMIGYVVGFKTKSLKKKMVYNLEQP